MAVALATLPLKRLLAGAGDAGFDAWTGGAFCAGLVSDALAGTGLPTDLASACLTGSAAFFTAGLAAGAPAGTFLTGAACLTGALFTGAFFTAAFFAGDFVAGLTFFGGGLAITFLAATFLVATLEAALLTTLAIAFFATTGLVTIFFATAFFAGLAADAFFAVGLLAVFTVVPFVAAVFGWPPLTRCALAGVFPFFALAAVELRVVFAISIHRFGRNGRVL